MKPPSYIHKTIMKLPGNVSKRDRLNNLIIIRKTVIINNSLVIKCTSKLSEGLNIIFLLTFTVFISLLFLFTCQNWIYSTVISLYFLSKEPVFLVILKWSAAIVLQAFWKIFPSFSVPSLYLNVFRREKNAQMLCQFDEELKHVRIVDLFFSS